ncbi:hypothetical protein [Actomonas aquatica]|uniref:Ig-like domain-containing protein n=1 Tax=Actomonas aquatica TaxID=2866162 RepID=A0ABZ1C3J6_9BACT|nr:hypothetical protein [Opitutus sp. WL0086]WRQ85927.1 hypothetical protein K1X11_014025 [Opitutus sp. WL0086]
MVYPNWRLGPKVNQWLVMLLLCLGTGLRSPAELVVLVPWSTGMIYEGVPYRYSQFRHAVQAGKDYYDIRCSLRLSQLPDSTGGNQRFTVFLDTPVVQSIRFSRRDGALQMRVFVPNGYGYGSYGGNYETLPGGDQFNLRIEADNAHEVWRIWIDDTLVHEGPYQPSSGDIQYLRFSLGGTGTETVAPYAATVGAIEVFGFNPPAGGDAIEADAPVAWVGEELRIAPSSPLTGDDLEYRWFHNGVVIEDADGPELMLPVVSQSTAGEYVLTVSNPIGSLRFSTEVDVVERTRLRNLSTRARIAGESQTMVVGFVTRHQGEREFLLRGAGPSLHAFGVGDAVADPRARLIHLGEELAANDNWEDTGAGVVGDEFARVGAFGFGAGERDTALRAAVVDGAYSLVISGAQASAGTALGEIYELYDDGGHLGGLVNLSTRAEVGQGRPIVLGFVVAGVEPAHLLLRAVGPGLEEFGLTGVVTRPRMTVFNQSQEIVATGTAWGGDAAMTEAAKRVGAFALDSESADAAMLLTLGAGAYTVWIEAEDPTDVGTALGEIYLLQTEP